jgi:putative tryptophan/tyrosine transport system substrate-binding protein
MGSSLILRRRRRLVATSRGRTIRMFPRPRGSVRRSSTPPPGRAFDTRFAFARAQDEFEQAFETLMQQKVDALMVCADPLFNSRRARLIALAARSRLPAMYEFREFPLDGGLISYGVDIVDIYRQVGRYTAAILKGASPAELPVLQPTKFALTVNLATARTLGLNVPPMLLALADEVIE